jgi:transposase
MVERLVGLDVSQRSTSICILDGHGARVWRGKCATDPAAIEEVIRLRAGAATRIGLETGPLTPWLVHELRSRGLEVVCLDARQARAALALRPNKTDVNDAEGLAQILRLGWHRSVHVKSYDAHRLRAALGARMQLVNMVTELSNHVRGVLKVFGIVVEGARGSVFADRVEALVADRPEVAAVVRPILDAWRGLRRQVAAYDVALRAEAKGRREVRLLMSVPGVGAITALAYASAVEDPARFGSSRSVGAHLGLTPRRHQSGEVDRTGAISRWGDGLVRTYLFEAATVLLGRVKRWSALRAWAVRLAQRSGSTKARVALARKLAVVMHAIWRSGEPFGWAAEPRAA